MELRLLKLGRMIGSQPFCLAAVREKKGVSLQEIAETTKISPRFLQAIEAEKFEELPGGIFGTSYLKQYAACVGLDQAELLARFHEHRKVEQGSTSRETAPQTLFLRIRRCLPNSISPWLRRRDGNATR